MNVRSEKIAACGFFPQGDILVLEMKELSDSKSGTFTVLTLTFGELNKETGLYYEPEPEFFHPRDIALAKKAFDIRSNIDNAYKSTGYGMSLNDVKTIERDIRVLDDWYFTRFNPGIKPFFTEQEENKLFNLFGNVYHHPCIPPGAHVQISEVQKCWVAFDNIYVQTISGSMYVLGVVLDLFAKSYPDYRQIVLKKYGISEQQLIT